MPESAFLFSLRPIVAKDAARVAELIGDWEVVRWLSMPPYPYALADANAFIARSTAAVFPECHLVIEIEGQASGLVGIDRRATGFNLGYWLGRPYWGRGIMTKAAARLVDEFFAKTRESHLLSGYFSGNDRSLAIQQRLGFETTGERFLLNRPQGKRLPHVETTLTRARYEAMPVRGRSE